VNPPGAKRRETRPVGHGVRSATPVALRVLGTDREIPLPLELERFAIGSDASNPLVLDDDTVSSMHCVLERRDSHRLVLKDRKSTNGTYVDGVRVAESTIEPGARIVLGRSSLALVGRTARGEAAVLEQLLGEAPAFKAALEQARRAARSSLPVLVQGESGTGKEAYARLVHEASRRAAGPFVAVNCAAIAASLVESELFGHEKGAFTGALARRAGVFEQADGGTLFLDEIGELPLEQQPKLLRVLETRRVKRVGGATEQPVDVRVVAATHRDLQAMTVTGGFRLDLFHRLAGFEARLPPLRERPEDLPLLVAHFLAEVTAQVGPRHIDAGTVAALEAHPWPGNVRELRQAIHRAAALSEHELELRHLLPQLVAREPLRERRTVALATPAAAVKPPPPRSAPPPLPDDSSYHDVLKDTISRALDRHGSQRRAAQAIGMSRSTFNERVRRYGLVDSPARRRFRPDDDDDDDE
jgi:DNA-binding NtrC family response regulator